MSESKCPGFNDLQDENWNVITNLQLGRNNHFWLLVLVGCFCNAVIEYSSFDFIVAKIY
ncbi:MAG TPA: hypothetical protein VK184_16250 [Nostocaceae cyanobacterium]|nr:hypothetical protein [Nostocaceae cyanobacterium]